MAKIALDEATPLEIRARMFAELAPYVFPKRRPTEELSDQEPPGLTIVIRRESEIERPLVIQEAPNS
jgi:hypothetical protein